MTEANGWVAGYNMVGYLPEMEPFVTDTWDSAAAFLIDELNRWADTLIESDDEDAGVDDILEVIHDLELVKGYNEESTYVVKNEAYWIVAAGRIVPTPDGWEQIDA